MNNIKIGHKQGGFVNSRSVAYMYYKSRTIFFRAQYDRLLSGFWFHADIVDFVNAIVHESIHIVLVKLESSKTSHMFDRLMGDIEDIAK